jgi:dCTP deaminase
VILSDRDIKALIDSGDLKISPEINEREQIQPSSLDVRLDNVYFSTNEAQRLVDTKLTTSFKNHFYRFTATEKDGFDVEPGEFIIASTKESITLPDSITASIEGRSSLGRLGISIHQTAGFIDPGFSGQITLEIANLSPWCVRLYPDMRIGQIVFYKMTSPSLRPYGKERGSKYQNQKGPVLSKGLK